MSTTDAEHLPPPALGHIPTTGRGSMPFALLHGEALVAVAAWAAGEAGIELLDFDAAWRDVQAREQPLVVHDPLCPLTPVTFLREAVVRAVDQGTVVVAVHAVTDTVKSVHEGRVGATVDRDGLWAVTSPVVLPAAVVAGLEDWPDTDDLAALVTDLRERFPVEFLEAPSLGRRVEDESAVVLLEAFADEHGTAQR